MDDDAAVRSRWIGRTLLIVGVIVAIVVVLLIWVLQVIDCDGGDGGSPYVAYDSPRGGVCRFGGGAPYLSIPPIAAVVGAIAAWVIVRRWRARLLRSWWLIGTVVLPSLLPVTFAVVLGTAFSGDCVGGKAAAYRAWGDAGHEGDPPFDCESY